MFLSTYSLIIEISPEATAALIGAATALTSETLIKPTISFFSTRLRNKRISEDYFERYSQPLASSCADLFYRLREILLESQRADFLTSHQENPFNRYKYISTLYRLSAVIAWIRCYKKEQANLAFRNHPKLRKLETEIRNFSKTLADGHEIESRMIQTALNTIAPDCRTSNKQLNAHAYEFRSMCQNFLLDNSLKKFSELRPERKEVLFAKCEDFFKEKLEGFKSPARRNDNDPEILCENISIRAHWIYRDHQNAIGDTLSECIENGRRRYEVKGFSWFEDQFESFTKQRSDECVYMYSHQFAWLDRVNSVFEDLSVHGGTSNDVRGEMLWRLFRNLCNIIKELHEEDRSGSIKQETYDAVIYALRYQFPKEFSENSGNWSDKIYATSHRE
jgi:hypothetical protein